MRWIAIILCTVALCAATPIHAAAMPAGNQRLLIQMFEQDAHNAYIGYLALKGQSDPAYCRDLATSASIDLVMQDWGLMSLPLTGVYAKARTQLNIGLEDVLSGWQSADAAHCLSTITVQLVQGVGAIDKAEKLVPLPKAGID
jgi:hypothetical protein